MDAPPGTSPDPAISDNASAENRQAIAVVVAPQQPRAQWRDPKDEINEAEQEARARAERAYEQTITPRLTQIYQVWDFLKWLCALQTPDTHPGPLEVRFCLYGVTFLGWWTGITPAYVAGFAWPTPSDGSPQPPAEEPEPSRSLRLARACVKLLFPLHLNRDLYKMDVIYYYLWVQRKDPNNPHAITIPSPAHMYARLRKTCYIYLILALMYTAAYLWFGWKVLAWFFPPSTQIVTNFQTSGICAQLDKIRATTSRDAHETTVWHGVTQALDFAAMAASMNFSAAFTPNVRLIRQRASRSLLNSWDSTHSPYLAPSNAIFSRGQAMDDVYSRIRLARDVIGHFQRGLLGLDPLEVADRKDHVDLGCVVSGLYGARMAEDLLLGRDTRSAT